MSSTTININPRIIESTNGEVNIVAYGEVTHSRPAFLYSKTEWITGPEVKKESSEGSTSQGIIGFDLTFLIGVIGISFVLILMLQRKNRKNQQSVKL